MTTHPKRLARILDAEVRYEPVPEPTGEIEWSIDESVGSVAATADTVWFWSEHLRVCVRGTSEVIVESLRGGDETAIGPMVYSWAPRILLMHAGTFSLHGSLVRIGDRHVVIGGHSGAGKSTTVMALAVRHHAQLLIDDIVPVRIVDGRALAYPFSRPVHLMLDTIERLGLPVEGERIGDGPYQKRAVDLQVATTPVPVDELVTLVGFDPDPHEDWPNTVAPIDEPTLDRPVVVSDVTGGERLRWIVRLANNRGLSSMGERAQPFFEWSSALAGALPTIEIARLRSADTLDEVCAHIVAGRAPAQH